MIDNWSIHLRIHSSSPHYWALDWGLTVKNVPSRPLFQTNITSFTTNYFEKCPSSRQYWDSNPRPFDHDSPPITTRPGLTFCLVSIRAKVFTVQATLTQTKKLDSWETKKFDKTTKILMCRCPQNIPNICQVFLD